MHIALDAALQKSYERIRAAPDNTQLLSAEAHMWGDDESAFRRACIEQLTRSETLDFMIDTLKSVALTTKKVNHPHEHSPDFPVQQACIK